MYDLIIIGAGPAGLTASIYASRYKINHLVIGLEPGGQGSIAPMVENFPGFLSIKGFDLMQKIIEQVKSYGVQVKREEVVGLTKIDNGFEVKSSGGNYQAKSIILSMGAALRHLNIPGEGEFLGKGVSYCATCDGPFFKDKNVAVIGGGDCALTEALHLTAFAKKVYVIYRGEALRAEPVWKEKAQNNPKIEIIYKTNVMKILGTKDLLKGSTLKKVEPSQDYVGAVELNNPYNNSTILPLDGVFIEIGHIPSSALVKPIGVKLDKEGYVEINPAMQTNVPGIFAAGDLVVMEKRDIFRQLITSASDGALAAKAVYDFLNKRDKI